jgi:ABC-2 type transport system permease protein
MRGRDAVVLVAGREVSTRLRSKAFKITTAIMLVAVVAFSLAFKLLGGDSGSKVGFTPSAAALAEPLRSVALATGETVTVSTVDQAAGEQQLRDGSLDALVTGTADSFQVVAKQDLSGSLHTAFTVLVRQLVLNEQITRAGGDPAAVAAAVESATVSVRSLEPAREFQIQRFILSIVVGIVVYIALLIYGPAVAQGVVEEKSSRIVEILLTTIRPWQLMLGKVFGIGLIGLFQLGLVAAVGVGAGVATGAIDFPASLAAGIAVWAVVWFLLGYLAYALMFAALGALVSRQEDVGGVTAPALMLIILPYVLGISILPADPNNSFLATASLIPLFSPTLMPMRIALGVAPAWQIALSVTLTALLIVAMVWLAGRIYGNAVLRTGSRVAFRDALRAASH